MEAKEIYKAITKDVIKNIFVHDDQMVAIAHYVEHLLKAQRDRGEHYEANLNRLRDEVRDIFQSYKDYWERNDVKDWDFEIREINDKDQASIRYRIEILCGRGSKVCIMRQDYNIPINKPTVPEQELRGKIRAWKAIIREINIAGAVKIYERTVELYRDGRMDDNGAGHRNQPLRPSESFQKPSGENK